jgi:signal-transduction protein with cAMP-binding, CBS, and nucleotidyltransferase domain
MSRDIRLDSLSADGGKVLTIQEDSPCLMAARKMRYYDVGCLVVVQGQSNPVGILTEQDMVQRLLAEGLPPDTTAVSQIMTHGIVSVNLHTSVINAQQVMAQHRIRHLPIIEDGLLMGIISSRDILAYQFSAVRDVLSKHSDVMQEVQEELDGVIG